MLTEYTTDEIIPKCEIVFQIFKIKNITFIGDAKMNFEKVKDYFEAKKESLYAEEEHRLVDILKNYFNQRDLEEIDGRTMAAVFRRFDVLVRYLS